ncbi:hypothetical protein IMZ48_42465 [Candidatus Bathyarchaeota archaeon]|nr:hypothetical protein [Candidatus Bathyarchaeota archaeon]
MRPLLAIAPPRRHDPTTPATTATKAFSTFNPASLPPSQHPSTTNSRRRHLNWRARPPSLCRPTYPDLSSRRYAASPIMAQTEWTGNKVRETFFDFFAKREHAIGM